MNFGSFPFSFSFSFLFFFFLFFSFFSSFFFFFFSSFFSFFLSFFLFFLSNILLFIHENTQRGDREAKTQAEGEAGSMQEPDVGLDPGSPGSHPALKAACLLYTSDAADDRFLV